MAHTHILSYNITSYVICETEGRGWTEEKGREVSEIEEGVEDILEDREVRL